MKLIDVKMITFRALSHLIKNYLLIGAQRITHYNNIILLRVLLYFNYIKVKFSFLFALYFYRPVLFNKE